jgi:hypothetical protein
MLYSQLLQVNGLAIVVVFYLVANGWFAQTQGQID